MIRDLYTNCQSELIEDGLGSETQICQCFDKTQHDKFVPEHTSMGFFVSSKSYKYIRSNYTRLRMTTGQKAMTALLFFCFLTQVGFSQKDTTSDLSTEKVQTTPSVDPDRGSQMQTPIESAKPLMLLYPQSTYTSTNNFLYHYMDRNEILNGSINKNIFSSVKPYYRASAQSSRREYDYMLGLPKKEAANVLYIYNECINANPQTLNYDKKKFLKSFYKYYKSQFWAIQKEDFSMFINPVLSFGVGSENQKNNVYTNTRGVEIRGAISNKIGYYTFLTDNQTYEPTYINNYINNKKGILDTTAYPGIMPGVGYLKYFKNNKSAYDYFITRGYITFTPVKNVNMMFGHDRNFIGNGIRSLILSDFSKDYMQLKINTKVWRFNYLNIFAQLNDYQNNASGTLMGRKYMAFHHLSMNLSKNFNLGLSETVIFARSDSSASTGYDINYLNPVIFYRSIEQNNNSADNSMIAADWKWNFLKRFSLYGQLVFDEFLLHHLVKQDGYWANKYSFQSGLKYINVFEIKNLDYQFEYNMIRPYTYTHFKTSTAFTNYGQPMAHPLGANLKEQLHVIRYQIAPKVYSMFRYMYTQYGADTSGTHWGQNIFVDYHKRQLQRAPNYDLGNTIGQGVKTTIQYFDFTLTYMPWHNLFLELNYIYRNQSSKVESLNLKSNMIYLNLRLNLPKRDMLF